MSGSLRRSLALLSLAALAACSDGPARDQTPPRPALVEHPRPAPRAAFTYSGEVRARYEPDLGFRIAGKIRRRLVNVGDRVKAGQPLAELNAEDVNLRLDAARARLAAARSDRTLAQADLQRYRKLLDKQVVSQSQFDTVQARYRATSASLDQARADLDVARNQRDYAVLRAPRDGVIASRAAEAGQVVAAGQTVFTLAVAGEREVRIDLPEQDIAKVSIGQPVRIALWATPDSTFAGHIRELSPSANPVSRTFEARIAFDDDPAHAHLGQSARVALGSGEGDASAPLSIPLAALTADQGQPFVWVVGEDGRLRKTPVKAGPYLENRVPVLAGLKASDWVVAAGTQVLHEGERVQPVDRRNRPLDLAAE